MDEINTKIKILIYSNEVCLPKRVEMNLLLRFSIKFSFNRKSRDSSTLNSNSSFPFCNVNKVLLNNFNYLGLDIPN